MTSSGGSSSFNGVAITMPAITQTSGTMISNGVNITAGTLNSGTANGLYFNGTAANFTNLISTSTGNFSVTGAGALSVKSSGIGAAASSSTLLQLGPSISTPQWQSQINLGTGGASPIPGYGNVGDMWWNGTSLYFQKAAGAGGKVDLLGSGYINNQQSSAQFADFWISGDGHINGSEEVDTALYTPAIDTPDNEALNIGSTNASAVNFYPYVQFNGMIDAVGWNVVLDAQSASEFTTDAGALTLTSAAAATGVLRLAT